MRQSLQLARGKGLPQVKEKGWSLEKETDWPQVKEKG